MANKVSQAAIITSQANESPQSESELELESELETESEWASAPGGRSRSRGLIYELGACSRVATEAHSVGISLSVFTLLATNVPHSGSR